MNTPKKSGFRKKIGSVPEYTLSIEQPIDSIQTIEIDPSHRMADINRENNLWPVAVEEEVETP